MYRRDCHAGKKVLQRVGELLTPPICLFFFASFPPGGTGKTSGTGFLCVLSKENFSSANVVTVSSFNQQV